MLGKLLTHIVDSPIIGVDKTIMGISLDSRQVKNNYLFVAIKGDVQDGHQYIQQAINNGAVAIALENEAYIQSNASVSYVLVRTLKAEVGHIASRFYDAPSASLSVIGVTGTNGKTSITHYIAELLGLLGKSCGIIGTLGIEYSGKKVITNNTTPDAITLQQNFHDMVMEGVANVAMEVSSHALDQYRCEGVRFDTAIMSNVTHDHLDYHGTFAAYEQAKLTLFSRPELRVAIINEDDSSAGKIRAVVASHVKLISYSACNDKADVFLSGIQGDARGYQATLHYFGQQLPFKVALLGDFNLYNVLAAIIALVEQGFSVEKVLQAAAQIKPVSGRMQLVTNQHNIVAVVDYAHTPDALESVLKSLRKQVSGKIFAVFGCGGDRDKEKRTKMAAIAEKYADYVVITADNPRTEKLEAILADIQAGMAGHNFTVIPERDKAIMLAVNNAAANDCVLVAGKGHEKTQIIGNVIKAFDDVEVLAAALQNKVVAKC